VAALDKSVPRTVVTDADQDVGVHGLVAGGGAVQAGDPVYVA
jgi:hypothetical protein